MPKLSLSPYLSIVLGVTLSVVFCLAAGLCRRYATLHNPDPVGCPEPPLPLHFMSCDVSLPSKLL